MIRRAKRKDLEGLLRLLYQLSPSKDKEVSEKQKEALRTILIGNSQEILVYESGGELIGTATVLKRDNLTHQGSPAGYIENIVVDKDYRRRGIGYQLVEKCVGITRRWNCYKIILTCKPELARFYGKSGFKEFGEIAMRKNID